MIDQKTSANKTGTLFYTKVGDGNKPYRVRFRSFQQGLFENRGLIQNLDQVHTNYNLFKYGKSRSRKNSLPSWNSNQTFSKMNKNMKDRTKDGQELKIRLKSMRDTRKSILQKIKSIKE